MNKKVSRLNLIKDIADNEFNDESDVVLLNCPSHPIIAHGLLHHLDDNVYPDFKSFLQNRLVANHGSLDKLIKELGFTDTKSAMDFMYSNIKKSDITSFNKLLAKAYGAVYLKDIQKIAILTSPTSLNDICEMAKVVGELDKSILKQAHGLLFYLYYHANIRRPMSYENAYKKLIKLQQIQ